MNKVVPKGRGVHRFHVTVAPGTKLESGPATLHLCNDILVVARDVPPAVTGQWKLSDLRRYGAVPNGFIFEGGTRCGYWAGVFFLSSAEGEQISFLFDCIVRGISPTKGPFGLRPVLPGGCERDLAGGRPDLSALLSGLPSLCLCPCPVPHAQRRHPEPHWPEGRVARDRPLLHGARAVGTAPLQWQWAVPRIADSPLASAPGTGVAGEEGGGPEPGCPALVAGVVAPSAGIRLSCSRRRGLGGRDQKGTWTRGSGRANGWTESLSDASECYPKNCQPKPLRPRQLQEVGRQSSSDSGIATGSHSSYSGSFSSCAGSSLDVWRAGDDFGSLLSLPPMPGAPEPSLCACPPGAAEYQVPGVPRPHYDTGDAEAGDLGSQTSAGCPSGWLGARRRGQATEAPGGEAALPSPAPGEPWEAGVSPAGPPAAFFSVCPVCGGLKVNPPP
nr:PREDICTED: protein Dok-7 [Equus przewalskii]